MKFVLFDIKLNSKTFSLTQFQSYLYIKCFIILIAMQRHHLYYLLKEQCLSSLSLSSQ